MPRERAVAAPLAIAWRAPSFKDGIAMTEPPRASWPEYRAGALVPGADCAVIQKVGQGGQAEVYVVRAMFLEQVCVMKLWNAQFMSEQAFRDFRAEAIKQAAMKHANIIGVTGGGMTNESPRRPYFLMEYLEGESLDRVLKRMQASERMLRDEHLERLRKGEPSVYRPSWATMRDAALVCVQVCAALTHAHAVHGLLHRDVKPGNIFIHHLDQEHSVAKLLDFGIAKLIADAQANPDKDFYGTLRYCAPEQVKGQACEASDLYAVAGIFYELLCGAHVFAEATSVGELMRAVLHQPPVPISRRMSNVSPRLEQFFLKNLHKNPIQRAVSARELAKEIAAIAQEYEDEANAVDSGVVADQITERMAFRSALAMAGKPSEENFQRAKLDSIWDSATGAAVEVGAQNVEPRIVRARPVDTDPMNGEEIAAKARAVEAEMAERQRRHEAAVAAAQLADRQAAARASVSSAAVLAPMNRRGNTVPMGPVLIASPELEHLEAQAREQSQIRATPRMANPVSVAPATRPQTDDEKLQLARERVERERLQEKLAGDARAISRASSLGMMGLPYQPSRSPSDAPDLQPEVLVEREEMARQAYDLAVAERSKKEAPKGATAHAVGLPRVGSPIVPDTKPAQLGDTDPSRVEPWDSNMKLEAPSVKVVGGGQAGPPPGPTSVAPPTERLSDEEQARQKSTAELRAHIAKGLAPAAHASTTPMAGAPGRRAAVSPSAPPASNGKGATVPYGPLVSSTPGAPATSRVGALPRAEERGAAVALANPEGVPTRFWVFFVALTLLVIALATTLGIRAVRDSRQPAHVDTGEAPMVTAQMPSMSAPPVAQVEVSAESSTAEPADAPVPSATHARAPAPASARPREVSKVAPKLGPAAGARALPVPSPSGKRVPLGESPNIKAF